MELKKYIRTLKNIRETFPTQNTVEHCVNVYWEDRKTNHYRTIFNYEVRKQADTIEELLDKYVVVDAFGNGEVYDNFEIAKETARKQGQRLYGAIWTNIGLKYAVMWLNNEWVILEF